ncbi:UNKNOWN [Stylonychia lemnae]|uniref:Uncharacterized protein n=1 Tax=Stylonychia lemnae TaxID=5949 RepID=A0A077ZSD0_STYLE|nr:UNKNOWN [Stylonychia lemnae]|eukprot:CDW72777.1 UNKNOWN [Stylonychia lemnae]
MQTSLMSKAEQIFGDLSLLDSTKVMHSHAVVLKDSKLNQIVFGAPGAPCCSLDLYFFNLLRIRAQCMITSGKIVRNDPYAFNTDFHLKKNGLDEDDFFNYLDEQHQQMSTKPLAIITRTLKTNFFEDAIVLKDLRFLKLVITEERIAQEYLKSQEQEWKISQDLVKRRLREDYNIQLTGIQDFNFTKAVEFISQDQELQPILSELGAATFRTQYINNHSTNPVDLLYLGIYNGQADDSQIGLELSTLDQIISQYDLQKQSKLYPQEDGRGKWLLTIWTKRQTELHSQDTIQEIKDKLTQQFECN